MKSQVGIFLSATLSDAWQLKPLFVQSKIKYHKIKVEWWSRTKISLNLFRLEKDDAVTAKHAAELHNARNLALVKVEDQNYRQQAADLAHKVISWPV